MCGTSCSLQSAISCVIYRHEFVRTIELEHHLLTETKFAKCHGLGSCHRTLFFDISIQLAKKKKLIIKDNGIRIKMAAMQSINLSKEIELRLHIN